MSAFEEWMSSINLSEFAKPLLGKGHNILTLKALPAEDLNELGEEIGMKRGHIIKLRAYVQKYSQDSSEQQTDSIPLPEEQVRKVSNDSELPPINGESQKKPPNSHDILEVEKRPIPGLTASIDSKETSNYACVPGGSLTDSFEMKNHAKENSEIQGSNNDTIVDQEPLEQVTEISIDKEITVNEIPESERDQQKEPNNLSQEESYSVVSGNIIHDQRSGKDPDDCPDEAGINFLNNTTEKNHIEDVYDKDTDKALRIDEKASEDISADTHFSNTTRNPVYTEAENRPEEDANVNDGQSIREKLSEDELFINEDQEKEIGQERNQYKPQIANIEEENQSEVQLPQKRNPQVYDSNSVSQEDEISEQFMYLMGILNSLIEQKDQFVDTIKSLADMDVEVPENALSDLKQLQSSIRDFCQTFR